MSLSDYEYPVDQCDVPVVRRNALHEYRQFRRRCLEYLRGNADSSVMNQIHRLTWHTAVFRTLNEARRLEPERAVNGAMWELISVGYAHLMTLGIRRLVDRAPRVDSLWNVIAHAEKHPGLLRRENFVCYDGLPYDYEAVARSEVATRAGSSGGVRWLPTTGPQAWTTSQRLHEAFDALAGQPTKRGRFDQVHPSVLATLKAHIEHPSIKAVCTLADKTMAHAERPAKDAEPLRAVTYTMIDEALKHLIQVASFLSAHFFYDVAFGSIVPVPQFNVLEALDQSWVTTRHLPALHEHWNSLAEIMDHWTEDTAEIFLAADGTGAAPHIGS